MSDWLVRVSLPFLRYSRRHGFMKRLNWCCTAEDAAYMRQRQEENMRIASFSKSESWMAAKLKTTGRKFTRQTIWGKRLFDFWNHALGVAVEVDGPEHRPDYDAYRDEYNFRRSAIVVLRVRNLNEQDAETALRIIGRLTSKEERKEQIGIAVSSKWLTRQPYPPSYLKDFLANLFPLDTPHPLR